MSASIAVVLVNYRNPEDTCLCLDSLAAADAGSNAGLNADAGVTVLVIENGSNDGSADILSAHLGTLPFASRLLVSETNLGFSGGCNLGIRHALEAGMPDILLLNNDTTVPEDFTRALRAARAAHPGAILSGALLDPETGKPGHSIGAISRRSLVVRHFFKLPAGPYRKIDFASGGLLLVPSPVFRSVGPLRDDFFMYCEDLEFCLRAADHNIPIIYAAAVRAWHREGSSSRKSGLPRVYYGFRNQTRIVWERGTSANKLWYFLFLLTQIKGLLRRPYITGQFLRGIRDGIRGVTGRIAG